MAIGRSSALVGETLVGESATGVRLAAGMGLVVSGGRRRECTCRGLDEVGDKGVGGEEGIGKGKGVG